MYECERCIEPAPKLPAPLPGRCMPKEALRLRPIGRAAAAEVLSRGGRPAWPSPGAGAMSVAGAVPVSAS